MQYRAMLGRVDLLAAKHRLDVPAQIARLGERAQTLHRFRIDALLRIVEIDADIVDSEALSALGIGGEQLAQMPLAHNRRMPLQRVPLGQRREHRIAAHATRPVFSPRALSSMRRSSSFHDLTKASVPSLCNFAASALMPTPARSRRASVAAQSPPFSAITPSSSP